ncbi:MAG: 6-phosphofructokinase [Thermoplasmata archaeon]
MNFGVLTGGGDCPGLNAAIRGVVFRAGQDGHQVIGFLDGWRGVRDGLVRPLSIADVRDSIGVGGTLLGTSRTNPFAKPEEADQVLATLRSQKIDYLVAIGGDDTLSAARELHRRGGKVVGVPKTMDNDVSGTDWTFGFYSASTVSLDALERLRDTARSHHRAIVLEVMGRQAGWVALATGIGGGADVTLLPEERYDEARLMRRVAAAVRARGYALIVASEGIDLGTSEGSPGARDEFGHELLRERGIGAELARRIEATTHVESRSAQIGHIQRGGPPTLFDRLLAIRLGVTAVELALSGHSGEVAVLRGEQILGIPFDEALGSPKCVDSRWLALMHSLEG